MGPIRKDGTVGIGKRKHIPHGPLRIGTKVEHLQIHQQFECSNVNFESEFQRAWLTTVGTNLVASSESQAVITNSDSDH